MRLKKIFSCIAGITMFASVGIVSYAGSAKSYRFNYYGTDDNRGSFSVSIDSNSEILQSRMANESSIFSIDLTDNSSKSIDYNFDLVSGGIISFALDGYGKKDNSFVIFDNGGRLIGYTSILKAVDTYGNEIDSNITVSNNKIHQTFDNSINIEDVSIEFEIYALQTTAVRANSFNDNFSKSEWITRTDGISLSLYPIYAFPTNASMYAAWDTVVAKHGRDTQWKNESGMKDQFHCHNDFASAKRPWNLEPWRPDVGYALTVKAGCNPK